MSSTLREYERFLRWLSQQAAREEDADVRRVAYVIHGRFADVAAKSTQNHRRSRFLRELLHGRLDAIDAQLPETAEDAGESDAPFARLTHLTVGPFRGFRQAEPFDLGKRVVLIVGPNGSGKTSLCEALEYSLLGEVEEADAKRIAPEAYLVNIHEGRFDPPVLRAADQAGAEVAVQPNSDGFRFFFVEKNRIDGFSRIAARTAGEKSQLIATLFGIEGFSQFVGEFNNSMDGELTLIPEKQRQLDQRNAGLAADRAAVEGAANTFAALDLSERELAGRFRAGMTFGELLHHLGNTDAPGRLAQLEEMLAVIPPPEWGTTAEELRLRLDEANRANDVVLQLQTSLNQRANEVSFSDLYKAVVRLRDVAEDSCPACDTPLVAVRTNPFDKAVTGLLQLEELARLQVDMAQATNGLGVASENLSRVVARVIAFAVENEPANEEVIHALDRIPEAAGRWWEVLTWPAPVPRRPASDVLLELAARIGQRDLEIRQRRENYVAHAAERTRLNELAIEVARLKERREQATTRIEHARARIETFEVDVRRLAEEAAAEAVTIADHLRIKNAYDSFLRLVRQYLRELPGTLMADLNEITLAFYNSFNRQDHERDRLASLRLPTRSEDRIEIAFNGHPERFVDALHVLSEGHIRCLGLAILLAKNVKLGCPVIIFDDAVNAIDHDHRRGIRETIFDGDQFQEKQIIVTCHGPEFVKDIRNHLPRPADEHSVLYVLRHHTGDHHPRVMGNVSTGNYLDEAQRRLDQFDPRGALASSRQALEFITENLWRWLGKHGLGELTLKLRSSDAEPTLRNLTEAIRKNINSPAFQPAHKDQLLAQLDVLLGIPAPSLAWANLNGGTHEEQDRDEFDVHVVERIVAALVAINGTTLVPPNAPALAVA